MNGGIIKRLAFATDYRFSCTILESPKDLKVRMVGIYPW